MKNGTLPSVREHEIHEQYHADCCIVGGGPAGLVLTLLLARQGVKVLLLESHNNFDRDFRGDTVHPSTLEVLDRLGLAEKFLQIPHTKVDRLGFRTPTYTFTPINLTRLKTKFPYIALMPQVRFLDFIAAEIAKYPTAQILFGANVSEMIEEDSIVKGVRFRTETGWGEVRSHLVVGADGRFSRLRKLSGFEPISTSPPMDVLWFRLPAKPVHTASDIFRMSDGHMLVVLDREDHWQLGYIIMKGSYRQVKEEGMPAFHASLRKLAPELTGEIDTLTDWNQVTPLNVESSRLSQWHRPGLLLIGDAAHVMSPVGGVGINVAIQDAVVVANLLGPLLRNGTVSDDDLARVQKRREPSVKRIQKLQNVIQEKIVANALTPDAEIKVPWIMRLPVIRDIPARWIAFGVSHELPV